MKNVPKLRFKEFPCEWIKSSLLSLSENGFSNGVFNDPSKVGSGYKLINVSDMYIDSPIDEEKLSLVAIGESEFRKNTVLYGDVFFTRSSLVKEGIACSNVYLGRSSDVTYDGHLIRMRPDKKTIDSIFLNYLLKTKSVRKQLVSMGKTATMTTIGQADIAETNVIHPKLIEQTKIATFLTAIDDRISQLAERCSLLEQYKKAVMQKIFSQELRFKDEEGRDFPAWEEKRLGDMADIVGGGTPDTSVKEYWNGDIQWFTPTEIKSKYIANSIRTITDEGLKTSSAKKLPIGTLLFTSRATVGDVGISLRECATNQGFQSFIVHAINNNEFIYYWILNNRKLFLERSSGSTFIEVSKKEIEKIFIKRPCKAEQEKIAGFLAAVDDKIAVAKTKLEAVRQYKQGLLQQMFV